MVLQIFDNEKQSFPYTGVIGHIDFGDMKILTNVS